VIYLPPDVITVSPPRDNPPPNPSPEPSPPSDPETVIDEAHSSSGMGRAERRDASVAAGRGEAAAERAAGRGKMWIPTPAGVYTYDTLGQNASSAGGVPTHPIPSYSLPNAEVVAQGQNILTRRVERETILQGVATAVITAASVAEGVAGLLKQLPEAGSFFYHYTTAAESSFAGGLWRETSVTDKLYTSPFEASQELGIPIPNKAIPIRDVGQFVPNKPPIVRPSSRYIGGGTDFINHEPVPPSQLLPAIPLEQ
jgi:hypothetical protein